MRRVRHPSTGSFERVVLRACRLAKAEIQEREIEVSLPGPDGVEPPESPAVRFREGAEI